ncbi:hypothetical protein H0A58_04335 [Alcaligenaceae bacterium]|nr:hypothetical protein [Alcaligenaceae bacterium]
MTQAIAKRHRNKVVVAWLASLLGGLGIHWWYMGRRHAWIVTTFSLCMLAWIPFFPEWWNNPAIFLLMIPITDGVIESLVFALMPDEKFDARYNPHSNQKTATGWNAVIAAIVSTFLGGTVLIFGIAVIVIYVYISLGWLDDYVI